jgi:hypothetical protein
VYAALDKSYLKIYWVLINGMHAEVFSDEMYWIFQLKISKKDGEGDGYMHSVKANSKTLTVKCRWQVHGYSLCDYFRLFSLLENDLNNMLGRSLTTLSFILPSNFEILCDKHSCWKNTFFNASWKLHCL